MERVCVFSWNSSCSTNYYNFSTNCTNCSLHGTSVTCSNVQLGVVCSLSVQEVRCNRTSQESNQAVCDMKGEYEQCCLGNLEGAKSKIMDEMNRECTSLGLSSNY